MILIDIGELDACLIQLALAESRNAAGIVWALQTRPDLVNSEMAVCGERGWDHTQRWEDLKLSTYGSGGGSAGDRRLIAEGLALLEQWGLLEMWLDGLTAPRAPFV